MTKTQQALDNQREQARREAAGRAKKAEDKLERVLKAIRRFMDYRTYQRFRPELEEAMRD